MGAEQSKQFKRVKQNTKLIQNRTSSSSTTNSSQQQSSKSNKQTDPFVGKIVVVSRGDNQKKDENLEEKEFLNLLLNYQFTPLLPRNHDTIPVNYQQIDSISMNQLCQNVQTYFKEKSDLAVRDQNLIYEKIKKIDYVTAFMANLIVEKEKSQNRTIDIFNRINELKILTQTYQSDLDRCFKNIEALNALLDDEHRLKIE